MTAVIEEKEPGVYVRSEAVEKPVKTEKDLDFFWEAPSRRVYDSQKNRIGIFAGGFVSGVFLTLIVTTAVMLLSKSMTASPGTEVAAPVNVSSVEDLVKTEVNESQEKADTVQESSTAASEAAEAAKASSVQTLTTEVRPSEAKTQKPATSLATAMSAVTNATTTSKTKTPAKTTATPKTTTSAAATPTATGARTHVIKSGDTLGALANKYYGSSDPALIEKIQKANNIKNPSGLQLNQKIVIPPKS